MVGGKFKYTYLPVNLPVDLFKVVSRPEREGSEKARLEF